MSTFFRIGLIKAGGWLKLLPIRGGFNSYLTYDVKRYLETCGKRMDPKLREWLSQLLHNAINMGVGSLMWRLPTLVLLILVIGMIAAVIYFKIY